MAGDRPQDARESDQSRDGIYDDERQREGRGGEEFHVLADALVRVVDDARAADAIVSPIVEVTPIERGGEPLAPVERQPFLRVTRVNAQRHRDGQRDDVNEKGPGVSGSIALRDRGHEVAPRVAHPNIDAGKGEDQPRDEGKPPNNPAPAIGNHIRANQIEQLAPRETRLGPGHRWRRGLRGGLRFAGGCGHGETEAASSGASRPAASGAGWR